MRNLKKVITMTLAIAMMLGMTVMGTSAAIDFNDAADIENTTAVNMNVALNIIQGDENGNFNPTDTVTRAQMAKMICVALGGGTDPSLDTTTAVSYTDTAGHWASGYIEYCTEAGIVAGSNGSFAPNVGITGTEAAKMLLVAIGYDAVNEGFVDNNSWASAISLKANEKNFYTDLAIDPAAALSRDDAAQMVWNALQAEMVSYDYELGVDADGNFANLKIAKDNGETILDKKYGADEDGKEGVMTRFGYNEVKGEYTYYIGGYMDNNDTTDTTDDDFWVWGTSFTTADDFTALYGHNVKVIYKNSTTVYGMYAEDSSVLFSGLVNDLTVKAADEVKFDDVTYAVENGGATYEFTNNANLAAATETVMGETAELYYTFDAIDLDGDNKIDRFMVYPFSVEKVTFAGTTYVTAGDKYKYDECDIVDGLAKGDYVKITDVVNTANEVATVEAVDETISGKINAIDGAKYYVDGVLYYIDYLNKSDIGTTMTDAPVVNGFIFGGDTASTYDVSDFAVVLGTAAGTGVSADQAKLLFADGSKVVVDTDQVYATDTYTGNTVTFEIKDDEYVLTLVGFNEALGFDGYIAANTSIKDDDKAETGDVYFIGDADVADDAVIFITEDADADASYSVITGAQLKGVGVSGLTLVGAFTNDDASGYPVVTLAQIETDSTLSLTDKSYGYVTSFTTALNDDDKAVAQLVVWNGEESVTLLGKDGLDTTNVAKGTLVAYTLNTDGEIDALTVNTTEAALTAVSSSYISYVTGVEATDNDGKLVTTSRMKLTDDTVYIYVDHEDFAGIKDGGLTTATKEEVLDDNDALVGTKYYSNVIVTLDSENKEVVAIVIDVNNDMDSYAYDIPTAATPS